ncbi:MAG: hypothetical protein HOU81_13215 [Hamadaea sp.]|nr:hypothetical protein [Hamadaea sp.]NUT19090.1 hypothetical protein [Hamadaea sp.]
MPYVLLMEVALEVNTSLVRGVLNPDPVVYAAALPLVAVTGLVPVVRTIEIPTVRTLLGGPAQALDAAGRGGRGRTALFWFLHLFLGSVVAAMTLAIPPGAVLLILSPFLGDIGWAVPPVWIDTLGPAQPIAGIALLALLIGAAAGAGALLAKLAPRLLGPSANDRIAVLRRTAEQLADRNRLARDLHDSVGHTLSVVMLQAGAAVRVLDTDPGFARTALTAIEEAARTAQAELDHVLGVLREQPRMAHLVDAARRSGLDLTADIEGDEARVPPETAHELQQIAREALTNAIRHGRGPVTLRLLVRTEQATLTVENPLPDGPVGRTRPDGGRGLVGIRERASSVGGRAEAGAVQGIWRVRAVLPYEGNP